MLAVKSLRSYRGASAFHAALDIEFKVDNNGNGLITFTQTKNKDNEKEKPLLFNLTQYAINGKTDKHGKTVTSCVIYPAEELMQYREQQAEQQANERTKPKMPKSELFALKTYQEAAKQSGEIVVDDANTGHSTILVDVEKWRNVFYEKSTADTPNAKRQAFNRAKSALAETNSTLAIKRENGVEYYCLDLSNESISASYRLAIRTAITAREKQKAVNNTDDSGNTGNDERTGELFTENSI